MFFVFDSESQGFCSLSVSSVLKVYRTGVRLDDSLSITSFFCSFHDAILWDFTSTFNNIIREKKMIIVSMIIMEAFI